MSDNDKKNKVSDFIQTLVNSTENVKNKILDPRDEYINNPNYQEQTSLGGALYNTVKGAGNMVKGLVSLPGQVVKSISNNTVGEDLVNTAKGYGNYINNLAGEPVKVEDGKFALQAPSILHAAKTAYNDPFNAAVTVLSARDMVKPKSKVVKKVEEVKPKVEEITIPKEELDAFKSQYTVPTKRAGAKDLNINGTSEEMLKHIKSGMKVAPEEAPGLVTGENGISTKLTNQIIDNTVSPIDVGDITTAARNILDKNKTAVNLKTRKAILSDITSGIEPGSYANGSITNMSAKEALALSRRLDELSSQYSRQSTYLTPSVKSEVIAKSFSAAADEIVRKLNEAAVKDGAISKIDQASIIAEANNISPLYAQQVAQALADTSIPLSKVRSTAAPFVKYQKIIDMTRDAGNSSFSKLANQVSKQPTLKIGNLQTTASDVGVNVAGFPGKVIGKVVDNAIINKKLSNVADFSKPWPTSQVKSPSNFPLALGNNLTKTGSYLTTSNQFNPSGESPNQEQNLVTENINQGNQNNIEHNGSITQKFTIPKSINEIQPVNNSWSSAVPDQYSIVGSDGQPLAMSTDSYKTNRANLNSQYEQLKAISDVVATKSNTSATAQAKSALDNLDTNYQLSQKLDEPYKTTVKSTKSIDEAKRILASAPVDLLNKFKSVDALISSTNADYSKLGNIIKAIGVAYPELASMFQPGQTKDVLSQNLDLAAKQVLNDYYTTINTYLGNPSQTTSAKTQTQVQGLPATPTAFPTSVPTKKTVDPNMLQGATNPKLGLPAFNLQFSNQ